MPSSSSHFPVLRLYEVVFWGENKFTPFYRLHVQAMSEDEAKADGIAQFRRLPDVVAKIERVEVLSDVHLNPARRQHTLFEDLADQCIGHSMDDVQGAAVNLLLTGVQRRASGVNDAERRWDELVGRGKQALCRRYRGDTDNRDAAVASDIGKKVFG
jgi:hypothetical protein